MMHRFFYSGSVLVLFLSAGVVHAQDNVFTNNAGGNNAWNTVANWSLGHSPTNGENAVITNQLQAVGNTFTPQYTGNLVIHTNASVYFNGNDSRGIVTNNPGTIIMHSNSFIRCRTGNGSGHVTYGPIQLLGPARINGGESTSGHNTARYFSGLVSGNYTLTLNGVNANRFHFQAMNTVSGITAYSSQGQNFRVEADATGSLGSGTITMEDEASLQVDVANVMGDTATLILNDDNGSVDKLEMNASDTISNLWMNGYQRQSGTYDNSESWLDGSGTLTVLADANDGVPTLASSDIVDDLSTNVIYTDYGEITYTITFSDWMDTNTVTTADFTNSGTATFTLGTLSHDDYYGTFTLGVTPTSTGTLILAVAAGMVLHDEDGEALNTVSSIDDDTTITILAGNTPPTTITNTVGGTDNWNTASNWDNGVPYGPGDAIVGSGIAAQVNTSPPDHWGDLIISNNASIRINSSSGKDVIPSATNRTITCHQGSSVRYGDGGNSTLTYGTMVLLGDFEIFNSGNPSHSETHRINGVISGSGKLTFSANNNNNLDLYNSNTFSGGFETKPNANQNHRVRIYSSGALGSGDVTIGAYCSLQYNAANVIDDEAILFLDGVKGNGTAKVDLNGNNDTIGLLFFDGTNQAAGTWGSSSSAADNTNDTWFSGTGILTVQYTTLENRPVSSVTDTSATFNAQLATPNTNYTVRVYWGPTDGTNNVAAWSNQSVVGSWTNVSLTNISLSTNGLVPGTTYYYTFSASNAAGVTWATPSVSFMTFDVPFVNNSTGATAVSATSATLRGLLTNGAAATAWFCWGTLDAGTGSTADWDNVTSVGSVTQAVVFSSLVSGLSTNTTYWYRSYVTNAYGVDWSDTAAAFNGSPSGSAGSGAVPIAVYREATGGDASSSSLTDMTWDTTVREDSAYALQGDNKSIRILEDGRYFCFYNLGINRSGRFEVTASLSLGGVALGALGKSTAYTRDGTGPNAWMSAGAIFDANANDDLILQHQRTSSADGTLLGSASGITLVKLLDSQPFLSIAEVGGGQTHNTDLSFASITFDSNTVASTDTTVLDHSTSSNTDEVEIKAVGKYLVTYSLEFENTATTRRNANTRLTLDGAEIDGTRISGYTRWDDGCGDPVCSWMGIIDVASASTGTPAILRLQATSEGQNTSSSLISQQGSLCITKLPDSSELLRTTLGSDVGVEGAEFAMSWPTPDEIDTAAFTYNAGTPSRIEVDTSDDYLFLASFYTYRTSSTTRSVPRWRWRKNGTTTYDYGLFSQYNRGDEGSEDTWSAGQAGAFIGTNMTAGDYIEVLTVDDYNTGDVNNDYKTDRTSLQAVKLSTIGEANPIANLAPTGITNNLATLNATLVAPATNYTVYVYWGGTDGGTNAGSWAGSAVVGSWTNVASTNVSYLRSGLPGSSTNWYTFSASNSAGVFWAEPSWRFTTLPLIGQPGTLFQFR